MKKQYKLDIFRVLRHTDQKDTSFFDNLTEEEQKAYQPLVAMRWLSGTTDTRQIVFLNELVNRFVFSIPNHKGLLYKLMTVCTAGKPRRYYWNKTAKKTSSAPSAVSVIQDYFEYSSSDAIDALPVLSNEDILFYAEQLGRQKDELTKLKRELKTR